MISHVLTAARLQAVSNLEAPRELTDSEKQNAKEGRGDFYGSGCRDWADELTGGEGKRMTGEALKFMPMKKAAKR
eukprot:7376369-Prymnesium_polylepis.1